jgi:UDP-N-acetylglucosamine 4,6-dehydratase
MVGIRPGEKIHEVMCPADDSHLTLEFKDHFVIRPTITFSEADNSYSPNNLGEKGTPAAEGFEYNSGSNERFLSVPEIVEFNRLAGIA